MRRFFLGSMLVAGTLLLLASPVSAQYDGGTGGANLVVAQTTLTPGQSVGVTGEGFRANSDVDLTLESDPVFLKTVQTDGTGSFSTTVTIPSNQPTGPHTVKATGVAPDGGVLVLTEQVQIVSSGAGGTAGTGSAATGGTSAAPSAGSTGGGFLAFTGWGLTIPLLVVAAVAIGVGVVMVGYARRRVSGTS